jgi:hypothetical protein
VLRSLLQPLYDEQRTLRSECGHAYDQVTARIATLERIGHDNAASILFSRWLQFPDVLASRNEVGHWLNWLGLAGEGVEVGVFRGEYSERLLEAWHGSLLTSVDPWRSFPQADYVDACNLPDSDHEQNYQETLRRLSRFGAKSVVLRETSSDAAAGFADASLDFVYLDAQHHYEAVRDDIAGWNPKVRHGGVIGGHDFVDGQFPSGSYGVKQAVEEFCTANGYSLVVTREPVWPSWFVRKLG